MGRAANFGSQWVIDRKFFRGIVDGVPMATNFVHRFTRCGSPYCARCQAGERPHGPYWYYYVQIDGHNHVKAWGANRPLPWGDNPPPSTLPSEDDPDSRLSKRRAERARKAAEKAAERRSRPPMLRGAARRTAAGERFGVVAEQQSIAEALRRFGTFQIDD